MSEAKNVAPQPLMPPYRVYRGFLDSHARADLLAWVIENEAKFKPTKVTGGNPFRRRSLRVRDFRPMETMLRRCVLDLVPTLIRDLRVPQFEPSEITIELVAHNDGAFFKRHIDMFVGDERGAHDRLLTAVYYFHAEPKAFSGGALRLYSFGVEEDESSFVDVWPEAFSGEALRLYLFGVEENESSFVDVWPEQNTLLAFQSWAPHEVLPVSCPSKRFADSRFSVNFWVNRRSNSIPSRA